MQKKVLSAVVILIIILVAGAGFWKWKDMKKDEVAKQSQSQQQNADNHQPAQQVSESEMEKVDTSGWQTYKNEEYGFEFKYPTGWNIKENRNLTTYLADRLLEIRPEKIDENNKNLVFYITISEAAGNPKEWYQTKYENPDAIKGYKGEAKELKINNLDAYYVVEDKDEYKQNSYVISKHKILIRPTFRSERDYNGNEADFSYNKYIPYFKSLVYSIK